MGDADDEPVRFFQQLIEASGRSLPGLGDYALGYLRNTMRVPVEAVMESLLVKCLIGAEWEEARSLFIEEGEAIRQLLQLLESVEHQPALQAFIRSLLSAWPCQESPHAIAVLEEGLTEREREVVCLAAKGMSNDEIGQQLALALGTVKWHLHNLFSRLGVRSRTQVVLKGKSLGLLSEA